MYIHFARYDQDQHDGRQLNKCEIESEVKHLIFLVLLQKKEIL